MNVESNIKVTLAIEEKNTLAVARDIINELIRTMQDYSCRSSDCYVISSSDMGSSFDGDEMSMSDLKDIAYFLEGISKSNSLELEI